MFSRQRKDVMLLNNESLDIRVLLANDFTIFFFFFFFFFLFKLPYTREGVYTRFDGQICI